VSTETTTTDDPAEEPAASHGHDAIHMPPNSWIPIGLALTLAMVLTGFLITAAVWIIGLVLTIALLVAWYRAARREFEDLPE